MRVATTHSSGWCLGERAVPYRAVLASTPTSPTSEPGWTTRLSLNWVLNEKNDKVYCLINLLEKTTTVKSQLAPRRQQFHVAQALKYITSVDIKKRAIEIS